MVPWLWPGFVCFTGSFSHVLHAKLDSMSNVPIVFVNAGIGSKNGSVGVVRVFFGGWPLCFSQLYLKIFGERNQNVREDSGTSMTVSHRELDITLSRFQRPRSVEKETVYNYIPLLFHCSHDMSYAGPHESTHLSSQSVLDTTYR